MTANDDGLDPFRLRLNFPYLLGTYLGINAIRGAYLIVDGPDCAFLKAQHVWGRHDLASTLLDPAGQHRIVFTGADGRAAGQLGARLGDVLASAETNLVVLTSLSVTSEAGAAEGGADAPAAQTAATTADDPRVLYVPGRSLQGDWLDGYAALLEALAAELPLCEGRRRSHDVGLVGYLFDRNEGDQHANVAELERLVERCGMNLCSVWLSGSAPADLSAIGRAGTVVALPYGRAAAQKLCERTGAALIGLDLPLGLAGTADWLRQLAVHTGCTAKTERVIADELRDAVPRLEPVVGRWLVGRRFFLGQDPFMAHGLWRLLEELGGEISGAALPARPAHRLALRATAPLDDRRVLCEPREGELERWIAPRQSDLSIVNSELRRYVAGPTIELGFPAAHHHSLGETPFLGFRGTVALVERIVNELLRP